MSQKAEILFENEKVIVIYKPAGLPVQTAYASREDVCSQLKNHLKGGYLGVIHRLDQPVEGLVVFAKTGEAAAKLGRELAGEEMGKIYLAEVFGHALCGSGQLTAHVKKAASGNISVIVPEKDPAAKEARLEYEVVAEHEKTSLVKIKLGTGRHHQIRLQLSDAGAPILGDRKYADEETKRYSEEQGIKEIRLCACRLKFVHPATLQKIDLKIAPVWCFTYPGVSDRL